MPLGSSATAGDWIRDFTRSKNQRFAGDDKKERIKRALGAYYAAHRAMGGYVPGFAQGGMFGGPFAPAPAPQPQYSAAQSSAPGPPQPPVGGQVPSQQSFLGLSNQAPIFNPVPPSPQGQPVVPFNPVSPVQSSPQGSLAAAIAPAPGPPGIPGLESGQAALQNSLGAPPPGPSPAYVPGQESGQTSMPGMADGGRVRRDALSNDDPGDRAQLVPVTGQTLGANDIGRNLPPPAPQADINGPIDPEAVKAYLARTGQIYPPLFHPQPGSMDAFIAHSPRSRNVEDRRPLEDHRPTARRYALGGGALPFSVLSNVRKIDHPPGMGGGGGGGAHLIASTTPGRTDRIKTNAPPGAYILPAHVVSGLGQGNTLAGAKMWGEMLSHGPYGSSIPRAGGHALMKPPHMPAPTKPPHLNLTPRVGHMADGGEQDGTTPIVTAGGEVIVDPSIVSSWGEGGDMEKGKKAIRKMVMTIHKQTLKDIQKYPGPVA